MTLDPQETPRRPQPRREPGRAPRQRLTATALSIIKLTWAQILLALVIGAALSSLVSEKTSWRALHHIGIGLLVAAVVTLFWHIREFSDFFERFARSILIDDEYLSRLNIGTLTTLRSRAGHEILRSCVDNDEYERDELADRIDHILYDRLLPDPGSPTQGMYRENFTENVVIENMTLDAALRDVGEDPAPYSAEALSSAVHKVVTTARYTVISPSTSSPHYPVRLEGRYADIPHFPLAKRLIFRVGHSEQDASIAKAEITNRRRGGMDVKTATVFLRMEAGKCSVWTEAVEFRSPRNEAHVLNTMALLTKNMQVDLFQTGRGADLVFDGGIVATDNCEPTFGPHSIHLKFDSWLFENQGYCIWWWEREGTAGSD